MLYRLRGRPRCFHCRAHCAVDLLSRARVPVERAHNGPHMRRACSSAPVFAPARRGQRSPDSYFSHFTLLQSQDISHGPVPIVAQLGERARPYCCSCGVGAIVLSHSAGSTTLLLLCRSGRRFIQCYATGGHCNRFEPVSKSRPLHQRHNQFTNYYRYEPNLLSR